jgi:hypothetical protein
MIINPTLVEVTKIMSLVVEAISHLLRVVVVEKVAVAEETFAKKISQQKSQQPQQFLSLPKLRNP